MTKLFSWEKEYRRTWEDGPHHSTSNFIKNNKIEYSNAKKGIIRHLHIMVDTSTAIDKPDFLPTFRLNIAKALEAFIPSFYSENPLSTLSFLSVRDVCDTYNNDINIDIREFLGKTGSKWFSLLNGLEYSVERIKEFNYVKEILVLTSSISTKDPGGYTEVLENIKKNNIKVHFISLCGDVTLFSSIARATGGRFDVPVDIDHFVTILGKYCAPTDYIGSTISLVRLGFPVLYDKQGICSCHLEFKGALYECPVCKSLVCNLPSQCPICETPLVSGINISKSYPFLYPLKPFDTVDIGDCRVCTSPGYAKCGDCGTTYCKKCDSFLHADLGFCLFCEVPGSSKSTSITN